MVTGSNTALKMRGGFITKQRRSVYVAPHRGIAVVRATSAGKRLGTDENRVRDEACWNTREHVRVTSVFRENPHKHCMEHLEHVGTPIS